MRIAFATLQDPRDVRSGSGTPFCLSRELRRQGHEVQLLGPLAVAPPLVTRFLARLSRRLGKRYRTFQDPFVGRRIGRLTTAVLAERDADVLLTNDYCIAAYTRTDRPVVIYTDSIFPRDYSSAVNPRLADLSAASVRLSQRVNRRGLERADLSILATRWAASEARLHEPCIEARLRVIPFGANLEDPGRAVAAGRRFSEIAQRNRIALLFVGRDWSGKGGPVALATAEELRRRGLGAELHLVGSDPQLGEDPAWLKCHGLLDKRRDEDRRRLDELYRSADVLILPSKGEGFGIAAVEAAAYGLPIVGYDTIGLNEAARHRETGILLPPGSGAETFSDVIEGWAASPAAYDDLARGARRHFEREGNWETACRRLGEELNALVERKRRSRAGT